MSDRFGHRPDLLLGLGVHTAAALGITLAASIEAVVLWRCLQGLGLATSVVCARAILRGLYPPREGARVMSKALTGLGFVAIQAPLSGGLAAHWHGWRAAFLLLALVGAGLWLFIALRLPETLLQRKPQATRLAPLLGPMASILRHRGFRAYAALVCTSYGALFVFLAGSSVVLMSVLGLGPVACGAAVASNGVAHIAGTALCRHLLRRHGLSGTVVRGAYVSALACLLMAAIVWFDLRSVAALLVAQWVFSLGHGVHHPCGQAGAVGPFPHAAGTASALAGFLLAITAVGLSLWLGQAMDGSMRPVAGGIAVGAALTCLVAWTLVRHAPAAA